ncbi:conserved hypothetical protein [Leishmania braziliensis MHOM/BR/75/M2904]|uniref:Uncharacterized protein n=2 Tax=Leishmania braziliensis TaxID=5660 RepID=A4H856_LEIBR|nr:conserved hypothetical protein [Leishmania braziliensis MHOM/BR/75/M2904]CAJ2469400.1 unnamed protein product [Leishmania braziliensis]CAM42104.1 conserved hypothetical protein [Leishmania braziliensis MHOM/BR/75/M2904]
MSPIPTRMPATASMAPSSAATASSADDANGLESRWPLRPPLDFRKGSSEETAHPAHHRSRHARQSPTSASSHSRSHSPPIASHLASQQSPSGEHGSDGAAAPVIPCHAVSALTSTPAELLSDGVALDALHLRDGQGLHHSVAMSSSAVLEHYHVLELEEQLQYWRQRALHMESRELQREHALQTWWKAEFATAQASSKTLIRKLLDKVHRLQKQLNLQKTMRQHMAGRGQQWRSSSASMDSSSTTLNSFTPGSSGHHMQKQQRRRRGYRHNSRRLEKKDHYPSPPTAVCHRSGSENDSTHDTPSSSDTNDVTHLRRVVSQLADENASLLQSLAALHWEQQESDRNRSAANASEGRAMHNGKPLTPTLQAHLRELCRAALGCMSRSSELHECRAALYGKYTGNKETTSNGDLEVQKGARVVQALLDELSGRQASDASSSLVQSLLVLRSALEHLNAVLLACVDDLVLASSQLTPTSPAASAPPPPPQQQQQPRDEHRSTDLEQLRQARAALFQEQQRRATAHPALGAATRDMQNLAQVQQDNVSQLKVEARTLAEQVQQESRAALVHTQAALQRDDVATTRCTNAAEHQSTLHAQREAQWQTQLSALTDKRNGYPREYALLRSRRATLQHARNATAAERTGQQQGRDDKVALMRQSHANARHPVALLSKPASAAAPRNGVEAKATRAASELELLPLGTSSSAPHVMWTDVQRNRLTPNTQPSGFSGTSWVPLSPSRSLSYSPPPSSNKEPQNAPGPGAGDTARTHSARLTTGVSTADSGAPRLLSNFPTPPIDVVQPSVLAAPERSGYADVKALAQRPYDNNSETGGEAGAPGHCTPLAKMRAWEEKFKAILRHA